MNGPPWGLRLAKIFLLVTHPLAMHQHPEINKHRIIADWETENFSWHIDSTPPPSDLSLWAFHAEQERRGPRPYASCFPRWFNSTTAAPHTPFPMTMITLEGICLTLVYHPGWAIDHHLVAKGAAWELLHSAPKAISPTSRCCRPTRSTGIAQTRSCSRTSFVSTAHFPLGTITDSPIPGSLIHAIRACRSDLSSANVVTMRLSSTA